MIKIIGGAQGTGKTKQLIDLANSAAKETKGLAVYIDSCICNSKEISTSIRFINTKEFKITSPLMFFGFLCGLIAGNYDIVDIYIDNVDKIISIDNTEAAVAFFEQLDSLTREYEVNITLTLTPKDEEEITFLKKFEYQEV